MSLLEAVRDAERVFIIGNGGSYANAMHMQNDLLSVGIPAFTLDPATLTAFANDHSYADAFARWILTVGDKGDLLIALSGSGKSPNILRACEAAESLGMRVHRIFGAEEGLDMQDSEERQINLGHELWRNLKNT